MPTDSQSAALLLALVAGAFGIGGTVIGQAFGLFSGWVQRRHDTRLRKRQRLEKLIDLMAVSLS